MLALVEIEWWHWVGFILAVLVFLALDLGVFHRQARVVHFGEALVWTGVWFALAMLFAFAFIRPMMGAESTLLFLAGYLTELSLSMDNVFVIALIFAYFRVPTEYQHRVLFWGILGALAMRGAGIGLGVELIRLFHWILYALGALLIWSGLKMLFLKDGGVEPEKNFFIRQARRWYPVTRDFDGEKFSTVRDGRRALTPLALVLVMVETTDLAFAVDSIPAIFGFTTDPFLVFTSNVFAILGLRSLYFVLAGAIAYFRHLKRGLAVVLAFIGAKMLAEPWVKIETGLSLAIVVAVIVVSIFFSVVSAGRDAELKRASPVDKP